MNLATETSKNWQRVFQYLIFFYAISLLLSISAMGLFSTLIVLASLVFAVGYLSKSQGLPFFRLGPDLFVILYFVAALLSYVINGEEAWAYTRLKDFTWIPLLYAATLAMRVANPSERVITSAAWVLGFVGVYCIAISFVGFDPIRPDRKLSLVDGIARSEGFLGSSITMAHSYGQIFMLMFGLMIVLFDRKERRWPLWTIATALMGAGVFLSFTRGVWLAVFVAILVVTFLYRRRWGWVALASSLVGFALVMALSSSVRDRITRGFDPERSYDNDRIVLWEANLRGWQQNPIFGFGYNTNHENVLPIYKEMGLPDGQYVNHAHNQYLQVLAGTGLFGFVMFIGALGSFWWIGYSTFKKLPKEEWWRRGLALGAVGAMTCFYVGGLTEANFEDSEVTQVWIFSLALLYLARSGMKLQGPDSKLG